MVHELYLQLSSKLTYYTDPGLNIEMKDFFRGCQEVESFSITITEDDRYKITIKLKQFSLVEAKKLFSTFLKFIEYPAGSFYTRKKKGEMIEYNLISFKEDMKGFNCEIEFIPAK